MARFTVKFDFIAFRDAVNENKMEGGKAYAFLTDYMKGKIGAEKLFKALNSLNEIHAFMWSNADAEETCNEIRYMVNKTVREQFEGKKAAK